MIPSGAFHSDTDSKIIPFKQLYELFVPPHSEYGGSVLLPNIEIDIDWFERARNQAIKMVKEFIQNLVKNRLEPSAQCVLAAERSSLNDVNLKQLYRRLLDQISSIVLEFGQSLSILGLPLLKCYQNIRNQDFESAIAFLKFSSTGEEEDISGFDEAFEKIALQQATALRNRRGPVMGIPDNPLSEEVHFELAEDVASNEKLLAPEIFSRNHRSDRGRSRKQCHFVLRSRHPRILSEWETTLGRELDGTNLSFPPRASSEPVRGPRLCCYLTAQEFFNQLCRSREKLRSHKRHRYSISSQEPEEAYLERQSTSLPDVYSFSFSKIPFLKWIIDSTENVDVLKEMSSSSESSAPLSPAEPDMKLPPAVDIDATNLGDDRPSLMLGSDQHLRHRQPLQRENDVSSPPKQAVNSRIPEPMDITSSMMFPVSSCADKSPSPGYHPPQPIWTPNEEFKPSYMPEDNTPVSWGKIKRVRSDFANRSRILLLVLFGLVALCWTLSMSPFLWGIVVGGFLTYCCMRVHALAIDFLYGSTIRSDCCCLTSPTPNAACCSLHNAALSSWRPPYGPLLPPPSRGGHDVGPLLPGLRDLPPPPLPHIFEEDVTTGPMSGPLSDSLGYRVGSKSNQPVYRAWMNETVFYAAEIYHINSTHSVLVTLEGTQLRIQRPKKNVPRRAMFNVPTPSSAAANFVHQRIFDMTAVSVYLLPIGLIEKRLWNKKYPICLEVRNPKLPSTKISQIPMVSEPSNLTELPRIHRAASIGSNFVGLEVPTATAKLSTSSLTDTMLSTKLMVESIAAPPKPSPILQRTSKLLPEEPTLLGGCRSSTTSGTSSTTKLPVNIADSDPQSSTDDFCFVRHSDVDERIYLFARTCREKEEWFRRLLAASEGRPLNITTQQAFQQLLSPKNISNRPRSGPIPASASSTSLGEVSKQKHSSSPSSDVQPTQVACSNNATIEASAESVELSIHPQASGSSGWVIGDGVSTARTQRPCALPYTEDDQVEYLRYMAKFMPARWLLRAAQAMQLNLNYVSCDSQILWLNALIGRVFWDFMRHEYWTQRVQQRIQSKLRKLRLPYFVNELTVTSVDLGTELPVIRRAGHPFIDNHGLWIEAEVIYAGGFSMSIETNVNLMKQRERAPNVSKKVDSIDPGLNYPGAEHGSRNTLRLAAFLSDEEDSAESSTDTDGEVDTSTSLHHGLVNQSFLRGSTSTEQLPASPTAADSSASLSSSALTDSRLLSPTTDDGNESYLSLGGLRPKKRFYRLVDRITRSSYFQKAVETKFVQRGIELVSNTPINLQLEVSMLYGTLVINVPSPPSDRLWYGFRGNPNLRFKLQPKVGEKMVTIPRVLEILEKKILLEFQRVFVLPNMDDIVIPLLIPESALVSAGRGDICTDNPYDISKSNNDKSA